MRILVVVFSLLVIVSCKKEGCTDGIAVNYDNAAKKDDGTCSYESQVSFWFNQSISSLFVNSYGVTTLYVYINDELVGDIPATDWKVGPDCGGDNFTVTLDLGATPTKTMAYLVNDQNGTQRFDGSIQAAANDCESIQLKY